MPDPYFLHSLEVAGFRAFLQPKTFDLSGKRCLAIFAPNGHGKSSVIDALEFMLSKDGTLARLGQRAVNNQAGPAALAHTQAKEAKVNPTVAFTVISGKETWHGRRAAEGANRAMPAVGAKLNTLLSVSPIIRGHELRTFVEAHTPEQRYADIARWLQLAPLVEVQKNIRALRTQVKGAAEDQICASAARQSTCSGNLSVCPLLAGNDAPQLYQRVDLGTAGSSINADDFGDS